MYEQFYGFTAKPFRLTPDPRFLFQSKGHSKALAYLRYGIELGEGFIVITGEVGAGKTTLARAVMARLSEERVLAVQFVATRLEPEDLLRAICDALGMNAKGLAKAELLRRIEEFLLARAREGKRVLLVIDEAQSLPAASLEELRMLSNFQAGERPILQSFLLGQGEFRQTLQSSTLEQFRQRVIAAYHLGPLSRDETEHYIEHRLKLVGWKGEPAIDGAAYDRIHEYTEGVPRRINTFCDRLFLYGCLEELKRFDAAAVEEVIREQDAELPVASTPSPELVEALEPSELQKVLPLPAATPVDGKMVTDAERRLVALEKRLNGLEKRLSEDHDRLMRLVMMAVVMGDRMDTAELIDFIRSVNGKK